MLDGFADHATIDPYSPTQAAIMTKFDFFRLQALNTIIARIDAEKALCADNAAEIAKWDAVKDAVNQASLDVSNALSEIQPTYHQ